MVAPANPAHRRAARRAILEFLRRPDYRPLPQRELLHRLQVPRERRTVVRKLLAELVQEGRIARIRGNRLVAAGARGSVTGVLEMHRGGHGFVLPDDGRPPVFVPPRGLGEGRHRDTVAVRTTGHGAGGRLEGAVVSVLDRAEPVVLGLFRRRGRGGIVEPFEAARDGPVTVPAPFRHGAREGDAVTVEVLGRARRDRSRDGKVLEILGRLDEPGVDVLVVARRYGLALEFPDEVARAAADLPEAVPRHEANRRERFDEPQPVTIDGETARDFDDAVAVTDLGGGAFRLFIHIADVAHFVASDGPLDLEARARGTSVYFPGTVLPMLPERLSNDLCSLRPGEDRLVQSVVLDVGPSGEVRAARFADGVIRSAARLTYTQVARVLDGAGRGHGVPAKLVTMLRLMDRVREVLERRRRDRGSIDFDLPEPEILLDVEGMMTGVKVEPRNRAHRIIEELMIAANEAVAAHLASRRAPCVYRVHEPPDPAKLEALGEFVGSLGLSLDGTGARPEAIQKLVDDAEGHPEYPVVAQMVLRSMRPARYATLNEGHFGLGSAEYCHFTSPIRRYPDLVVHRQLREARRRRRAHETEHAAGLEGIAQTCSILERNAEAAERELLTWKTVVFMRGREGEEFDGVVTGVTPFGLFVQLAEVLIDGLLRVEDLGPERFEFVEARQELRGRRSGERFRLGQRLRVRVRRVDTILRRIDVEPVEQASGGRRSRTRSRATRGPTRGRRPRGRGAARIKR